MGNPYTTTSVTNYNSNPPPDDGSQVASNIVAWSTIKTKLPDPIKTAFDSSETATNNAFAKVIGGGGFTTTATNYQVLAADQGKFIKATAACTVTTPDATSVGSPFVFAVVNESASDVTLAGDNPGVHQTVDGSNTVTIPAGMGLMVNTDGTNWFTTGQNFNRTQVIPQGRLTLVSATPVMVSDQTAKTAIFYTPYNGDLIPIPINGSTFTVKEFSELTLTLNGTNYVAGNLYDVYVSVDPADSTTVIVGSSPAWTTATAGSGARGSGAGTAELTLLKGLNVNKNAMTLRNNATTYSIIAKGATYVGTFFVDTTNGQVNCHVTYGQSRRWDLWNAFNRKQTILLVGDATASWSTTGTLGPINANTANSAIPICGLREDPIDATFSEFLAAGSSVGCIVGIGVNSTTTLSGMEGRLGVSGAINVTGMIPSARHNFFPPLGQNVITALEQTAGNANTVTGGQTTCQMTLKYLA